jgi:hypothetical protein
MVRTLNNKLFTILASLLLAGALATTVGCGTDDDDDCVGAGCLSPSSDVDAGAAWSGAPCEKVCGHIYEFCDTAFKVDSEDGPSNMPDCVMLCNEGYFTEDESFCLNGVACNDIASCMDDQ